MDKKFELLTAEDELWEVDPGVPLVVCKQKKSDKQVINRLDTPTTEPESFYT